MIAIDASELDVCPEDMSLLKMVISSQHNFDILNFLYK